MTFTSFAEMFEAATVVRMAPLVTLTPPAGAPVDVRPGVPLLMRIAGQQIECLAIAHEEIAHGQGARAPLPLLRFSVTVEEPL